MLKFEAIGMESKLLDGRLIRGARGLLGWSLMDLAKAAGVSVSTVKCAEDGTQTIALELDFRIRCALQVAKISFMQDDGNGLGLRLATAEARPLV